MYLNDPVTALPGFGLGSVAHYTESQSLRQRILPGKKRLYLSDVGRGDGNQVSNLSPQATKSGDLYSREGMNLSAGKTGIREK